jgi:hypothetical protein
MLDLQVRQIEFRFAAFRSGVRPPAQGRQTAPGCAAIQEQTETTPRDNRLYSAEINVPLGNLAPNQCDASQKSTEVASIPVSISILRLTYHAVAANHWQPCQRFCHAAADDPDLLHIVAAYLWPHKALEAFTEQPAVCYTFGVPSPASAVYPDNAGIFKPDTGAREHVEH